MASTSCFWTTTPSSLPGTLERLVAELDTHPEADAVSATVVGPDGRVQHSGGWVEVSGGIALFTVIGEGAAARGAPPERLDRLGTRHRDARPA